MTRREWRIVRQRNFVGGIAATFLSCFLLALEPASAQWTMTNLHPPGEWVSSSACGATSTIQAGVVISDGLDTTAHAGVWTGTANSWVSLEPEQAVASAVYSMSGTQAVGYAGFPFGIGSYRNCAVLWNGTAASIVSLHPKGAVLSEALGTSGTQQVGWARFPPLAAAVVRASLWTGTAESWVELHPPDADDSIAYAIWGQQQVGVAYFKDVPHACLWNGTSESWLDLHPEGYAQSIAYATSGTQQVGAIDFDGIWFATLWNGSAKPGSWVTLMPWNAQESRAYGISGDLQVGVATYDGIDHASLWSGTSESWVDLGAFVPSYFSHTRANSIWCEGSNTYVAGSGFNTLTNREEALIWVRAVCPADINKDGVTNVNDLLAVINVWGNCNSPCPPSCAADITDDCTVNVNDLLEVINGWGPCR